MARLKAVVYERRRAEVQYVDGFFIDLGVALHPLTIYIGLWRSFGKEKRRRNEKRQKKRNNSCWPKRGRNEKRQTP
jgi:hypothetical protein